MNRTGPLSYVCAAIGKLLAVDPAKLRIDSVSGGCISSAYRICVTSNDEGVQRYFAKVNSPDFLENFRAESVGLSLLSQANAIKTPKPLHCEVIGDHAYLVTEWIESGKQKQSTSFYQRFGRELAELHLKTRSHNIGLEHDNFLGAAVQLNSSKPTWPEFFAENRLRFQLDWGIHQKLVGTDLRKSLQTIIEGLDESLRTVDQTTSLLHGDLWSGNYLSDVSGQPVIIDPAVYYGHREAEFGMLQLFGNCPPAFYEAYNEVWPLEENWQRRVMIYTLYHLLNHLNLFGHGYVADCQRICDRIIQTW